jgi:hypothetical protein
MRRIRNYTFIGFVAVALFAAPVLTKASIGENPCGDNVACNADTPCDMPLLCGCTNQTGGICVPIPGAVAH